MRHVLVWAKEGVWDFSRGSLIWALWAHRNAVIFSTMDATQSKVALACKTWHQLTTYMVLDWRRIRTRLRLATTTDRIRLVQAYTRSWGSHPLGPRIVHEEMFVLAVPALTLLMN